MIVFNNVSKGFRTKSGEIEWVIRDFTGTFQNGKNIGILARKGAGKTTLVNLMAGVEPPTKGTITRTGSVSWPFGYRGYIANRLTARQNIRFITDLYGRDFKETIGFISEFAEISSGLDHPMNRITGEMRSRLAGALIFAMKFRHLLFDEMTGFGDAKFRKKCFDAVSQLNGNQNAIILTANPEYLRRYCQIGGILESGNLVMHDSIDAAIDAFKSHLQPAIDGS